MKRLVLGLIIGLLVGTAGTALAASETVQATLQKFVFKVNGIEKQLDADPLVYQGTTYLPVREVANMLGYDVTYRADSRTIELTSTRNETPSIERGDTVPNDVIQTKLNGRELVEILGQKYPNMVGTASSEISLGPDGTLRFGDQIFHLEKDQNGYYDIDPLIKAGIIGENDF